MLETVIGGSLAILGIVLAMWGSKLFVKRINWRIGLGLPLALLGLFMLFQARPNDAAAFYVLATLVLAFAALMAIKQATDTEVARKRAILMRDISEWATSVGSAILRQGTPQEKAIVSQRINKWSVVKAKKYLLRYYNEMEASFTPLRMRSVYIKEIANGDPKLQKYVDSATENLRSKLRLLHKYYNNMDKIESKGGILKAAINVATNEHLLYVSIVDLIKQIGGIASLL